MATAKIRTVKGLRVEIFSRPMRKNTTRPLTVWIGGTGIKQGLFLVMRCAIFYNCQIGVEKMFCNEIKTIQSLTIYS